MTISDILQQFHNQELSFPMLLRRFFAEPWLIPVMQEQPMLQERDEELILSLSSTQAIFSRFHNSANIRSMTRNFSWIFNNIPPDLDSIFVDLGTKNAIQIPREYFDFCQILLECNEIETIFQREVSESELQEKLQGYPSFLVPLIKDENGMTNIALVPDNQNRILAAVFTAPDCLHAFQEASKGKLGEFSIDEVAGHKLFSDLNLLPLDGLVFNCYGPVQPQAIGKELIRLLGTIIE